MHVCFVPLQVISSVSPATHGASPDRLGGAAIRRLQLCNDVGDREEYDTAFDMALQLEEILEQLRDQTELVTEKVWKQLLKDQVWPVCLCVGVMSVRAERLVQNMPLNAH